MNTKEKFYWMGRDIDEMDADQLRAVVMGLAAQLEMSRTITRTTLDFNRDILKSYAARCELSRGR